MLNIRTCLVVHVCSYWETIAGGIRDLWTPSHGRTKFGQPARTYLQQLCADKDVALSTSWEVWTIKTGGERGSGKSVLAARHDDDDDDDDTFPKSNNRKGNVIARLEFELTAFLQFNSLATLQ